MSIIFSFEGAAAAHYPQPDYLNISSTQKDILIKFGTICRDFEVSTTNRILTPMNRKTKIYLENLYCMNLIEGMSPVII